MNVVILGATGFIGRALCGRLQRDGARVTALVRRPAGDLAAGAQIPWDDDVACIAALSAADAVVNLAGEPVAGRRWTPAVKQRLVDSRVGVTRALVERLTRAERPPGVLVQGSAIGYYGDARGPVDEGAAAGEDFLARLTVAWESEAMAARRLGVRVVLARTSVVLGRGGGALAAMQPIFALGLGGPVGSGRQPFPWIHLEDEVHALTCAIGDARWDGPVNLSVAPVPTAAEFARALGRALHRPAVIPVPAVVLKAAFGEGASVVLGGQNAVPGRLTSWGFAYRWPELGAALADAVRTSP